MNRHPPYGEKDATFQAAGGEAGVRKIVDQFYDIMSTDADYALIWSWHPNNNTQTRDKLALFLCGWMGEFSDKKNKFSNTYGPINIPKVHAHLAITERERDLWLSCMRAALIALEYDSDFTDYLLTQLLIPANRILQLCQRAQS